MIELNDEKIIYEGITFVVFESMGLPFYRPFGGGVSLC